MVIEGGTGSKKKELESMYLPIGGHVFLQAGIDIFGGVIE
jgi:hypothetical protein